MKTVIGLRASWHESKYYEMTQKTGFIKKMMKRTKTLLTVNRVRYGTKPLRYAGGLQQISVHIIGKVYVILYIYAISRLYFLEEFRIFWYFPVVPSGTMLPYATRKQKRGKKENQRNVSLPALHLIYIRIYYVGLP